MRRILSLVMVLIILISGCSKNKITIEQEEKVLTAEMKTSVINQIDDLLKNKSWGRENSVKYKENILPYEVRDTYYSDILDKSKNGGYDFSNYLGKPIIEAQAPILYKSGDGAGIGHFLFHNGLMVGAYYTVGNYIYSFNERETFKKDVEWLNIENIKKTYSFKQLTVPYHNLIGWSNVNKIPLLIAFEDKKLKMINITSKSFNPMGEINLEGLYPVSVFIKDIDNDNINELILLASDSENYQETESKCKLLIYEYGQKLRFKYSYDFDKPMLSADFDGPNIVVTSKNTIEIYKIEKGLLKSEFIYNKIGGIIKIDDIDNNGRKKYILRDNEGKDIYVFEKSQNGLDEIWRSHNEKSELAGKVQTADLNGDGVKEIYIWDNNGGTKKLILAKSGFIFDNRGTKKYHRLFAGDFNADGKDDYFDIYKASSTSSKTYMVYRY